MTDSTSSHLQHLTFEESLSELQEIVQELENGSVGLEESLKRYELGVGLLRHCYEIINTAEQKLELLTGFDEAGQPTTEPFDGSATLEKKSRKSTGSKKKPPDDPSQETGTLF